MSFVPVTGPATYRPANPAGESVVEFSDDRRTVTLPIRGALPVLTKTRGRDDVHPSIGLLSGAVLMGMQFVADGKLEPADVARERTTLESYRLPASTVTNGFGSDTFELSYTVRGASASFTAIRVSHVENRAEPLYWRRCVKAFT